MTLLQEFTNQLPIAPPTVVSPHVHILVSDCPNNDTTEHLGSGELQAKVRGSRYLFVVGHVGGMVTVYLL